MKRKPHFPTRSCLSVGLLLLSHHVLAADPAPTEEIGWFATVDKTQAEQPHWMTPLVTVTPRLEEEFRYDQTIQNKASGVTTTNNGSGKGLELIPSEHVEVIIGVPNYINNQTPKTTTSGWADETFLMKYRFLAANEESGNYIVTGFLGVSTPSGDPAFTQHYTVTTPTLAVGKGWGSRESGADVQSTLSESFPTGNQNILGIPVNWNTSFQAHVGDYFWPEVEASYTHWRGGQFNGKDQLIMTYGLILGRFPIGGRAKLILGAGYQTANMSGFSLFGSGWIATGRVAF